MKTALYAVTPGGKPIAELQLSEGADRLDAELFVLKGGVPGAWQIADLPAVPTIDDSSRRIDAATREAAGLPPTQAAKDSEPTSFVRGSLEESRARTAAAITGLYGGPAVAGPARSTMRVVTVPKWESPEQKALREAKERAAPAPAPTKPPAPTVELREVPTLKTPNLEESTKRIDKALAAL